MKCFFGGGWGGGGQKETASNKKQCCIESRATIGLLVGVYWPIGERNTSLSVFDSGRPLERYTLLLLE